MPFGSLANAIYRLAVVTPFLHASGVSAARKRQKRLMPRQNQRMRRMKEMVVMKKIRRSSWI